MKNAVTSGDEAKKILVIDDDVTQRILVKEYLEAAGYVVRLAEDGRRGLRLATTTKPTAILLDMMLPSLDGLTVCACLKENPSTADIPVILITGSREPDVIERGLAAGAADFLTKPVDWDYLPDRISNVLARSNDVKRLEAEKMAIKLQLQAMQAGQASTVARLEAAKRTQSEFEAEVQKIEDEAAERIQKAEANAAERIAAAQVDADKALEEAGAQHKRFVESLWQLHAGVGRSHMDLLSGANQRIAALLDAARTADEGSPLTGELVAINDAMRSLHASVSNLRFLAMHMSGKVTLTETEFDIAELVASISTHMAQFAKDHGVTLDVESGTQTLVVRADNARMRLVLFSLLSNAVRRSASGDVVKVRLSVEEDSSVKLEIADRGAEPVSLDAVLADPVRMLDGHDGDAGMELPLAMAILRCHDGQLQSAPSEAGDMVASIKLPASRLVSAPRPARAVVPVETAMRKAG